MPENQQKHSILQDEPEERDFPLADSGLRLSALTSDEFLARWSLNSDAVDAAMRHQSGNSQLVLRVYALPARAESSQVSGFWQDFSIDGLKSSAQIRFTAPADKINASIGLINKSGRFRPLVRAQAIVLPRTPSPEPRERVSPPPPASGSISNESDSKPAEEETRDKIISATRLAESLADSAEDEIIALFTLGGKLAQGMKLMIGHEIVEADAAGFVRWEQKLDDIHQILPLLGAALLSPSVPAGPALQFYKDASPSDRILELQAQLEVAGKVNDPAHLQLLPAGLHRDAEGRFKLSRALPAGAVILPGISVIAG